MTTRAQEWPHVVYVTPSVTCFSGASSGLRFFHLTRIYRIRVALSANWLSNNGFLITQIFMLFLFCFVFFRKAKTLDDGKIQCTLKVDWGEYNGKGPNMKIAKATAAKLAIEGLKKKYAAVYEEE